VASVSSGRDGTGTTPGGATSHFPGFDVLRQADHWDDVTRRAVLARLAPPGPLRFFTDDEARVAAALHDQLLDQRAEPRVPVLHMIDGRLADGATDGWHHGDMPTDAESWRRSLRGLDADARVAHGCGFADCDWLQQSAILVRLQERDQTDWHGLRADWLWGLWTRYACTAFYSHPFAWNEIGFSGPAYPRGYKNAHVGGREPWEVREQRPVDPVLVIP
jgi:hypothetical protein